MFVLVVVIKLISMPVQVMVDPHLYKTIEECEAVDRGEYKLFPHFCKVVELDQ